MSKTIVDPISHLRELGELHDAWLNGISWDLKRGVLELGIEILLASDDLGSGTNAVATLHFSGVSELQGSIGVGVHDPMIHRLSVEGSADLYKADFGLKSGLRWSWIFTRLESTTWNVGS